ncbi:zinc finger protein 181-like [Dendropsophus ebraccatus]|uniref:zinc finger protein 181-like n=1 Tax=Dendropsophus ebraccatus TaxID=150705 RepID=UPI0038313E56
MVISGIQLFMMSEQGNESETSQFSALGPSSDGRVMQKSDNPPPSISTPNANNEAESKSCSVNESEEPVNLDVPHSKNTDNSSAPLLPKQASGVPTSRPAPEVSERRHLEKSPPDTSVENFQNVSSTDSGNAATTADVEDLNDFLMDGSDPLHCDIEEEASSELESMSYPPAFDQHMRGMSDKPYGCKFCTRRFSHRSSLYRHQKSHSGEKLYKCSECNKSFTNSSNLSVHSRIHTGEKPYECNGCGKKFTRKFALDQHLKIHKQEKLYICSHCGKSYYDYFFLLKHQQMERPSAPYIPDSIMK